jgi:hypothetical protein
VSVTPGAQLVRPAVATFASFVESAFKRSCIDDDGPALLAASAA